MTAKKKYVLIFLAGFMTLMGPIVGKGIYDVCDVRLHNLIATGPVEDNERYKYSEMLNISPVYCGMRYGYYGEVLIEDGVTSIVVSLHRHLTIIPGEKPDFDRFDNIQYHRFIVEDDIDLSTCVGKPVYFQGYVRKSLLTGKLYLSELEKIEFTNLSYQERDELSVGEITPCLDESVRLMVKPDPTAIE